MLFPRVKKRKPSSRFQKAVKHGERGRGTAVYHCTCLCCGMIANIDCMAKDQTGRPIYRTCRSCTGKKGQRQLVAIKAVGRSRHGPHESWASTHAHNWMDFTFLSKKKNGFHGDTVHQEEINARHAYGATAASSALLLLLLCKFHSISKKKAAWAVSGGQVLH